MPRFPVHRHPRAGAALIVALFLIVVIGALAVVSLAGLRSVRRTESATQAQRRATALEALALEEQLGPLREAARARAILPPRDLPPELTAAPGLEKLLALSQGGVPLTAGKRALPAPDLGAPRLHTSGEGPAATQAGWLYLGAEGPLTEAQAEAAPRQVLGRYAFTLWDLAGCLDLNHASHDSLPATAETALWQARRGDPRTISSEFLPGWAQGLSTLLSWRDVKSAAGLDTYRRLTEQFLPATAGRQTLEGTRRFLTRRELLSASTRLSPGIPPTTLAHYRTFSSGLAAPSARSPEPLAGHPVAEERPLTTGQVLPGNTPVLARRFPLERLNLLSYDFPATPAQDPDRQREIRRWFGLWRASSADPWTYVGSRADGSAASGPTLELPTLAQIAAEFPAREPNFFETLKAALTPGSLGQNFPFGAAQRSAELQASADLHLVQIGLNLIDQWDADGYPTVAQATPDSPRQAGIENLPYLSQLHLDALNPFWFHSADVPFEDRRVIPYLIPELWNPHQLPANGPPSAAPLAIRLRLEGTVVLKSLGAAAAANRTREIRFSGGSGALVISAAEFPGFNPVPRPVLNAAARDGCWDNSGFTYKGAALNEPSNDGRLPHTSFYAARLTPDPTEKDVLKGAFDARPLDPGYTGAPVETANGLPFKASNQQPYPGLTRPGTAANRPWVYTTPEAPFLRVEFGLGASERFDVVLDYLDHEGRWIPYASFAAGSPAHGATHGLGNAKTAPFAELFPARYLSTLHHLPDDRRPFLDAGGAVSFFKADPRTARLGVAVAMTPGTPMSGLGGLPARGPMRWPSILDLEAGAWSDLPLHVADALSLPNSLVKGPGGFYGRGLLNRFNDTLSKKTDPPNPIKFATFNPGDPFYSNPFGGLANPAYFPGLFGENLTIDARESHYLDPDGQVRPGDGWLWRHAIDEAHGVSPGAGGDEAWLRERSANQLYTNQAAFPRVLDRAFRSVAELGHVFRDLPQRSLDLTSPQSPDVALLDAFCLRETPLDSRGRPLTAGGFNPAVLPEDLLAATLAGTAQAEPQPVRAYPASPYQDQRVSNAPTTTELPLITLTRADAAKIAAPFLETTRGETGTPPESPADLIPALADHAESPGKRPRLSERPSVRAASEVDSFPALGAGSSLPFPAVKSEREAPLRALADSTETRVWNLFLDLTVESGQLPSFTTALDDFTPTARRRAWYHLAIDRLTGQVLEVQRERASF
jgi:hypothetical protein